MSEFLAKLNVLVMRLLATASTALALVSTGWAADESIWEFSPYHVQVWIAYDAAPHFTPGLHQRVAERVSGAANVIDPSGWILEIEEAPGYLRYPIVNDLAEFELSEEDRSLPAIKNGDKLIFVGVKRDVQGGWIVTAREYDCQYTVWSFPARRRVLTLSKLADEIFSAIQHAFVPLARITFVEDKQVQALTRAGGLLIVESSDHSEFVINTGAPAWIARESICAPIKRRSIRSGGKTQLMTTPIEWTYAVVDNLDTEKAPVLECSIFSAMRAPLGGKRGSRSDRVLRVVKPDGDSTQLLLTDRSKEPKPVAGYEIYSVLPNQTRSKLLGKTGLDGTFFLKRSEHPLQLLYVRSGSRILARLPVVPGLQPRLTAQMYSDEVRLRAEGIVKGMQNNLLNLIALRQSLSVQIRSYLEKKNVAKAEELMAIFNNKQKDTDFNLRISEQQVTLVGKTPREKQRIDALFNELKKLANEHLTNKLGFELIKEINHVRAGGKLSDIRPSEIDKLEDDPN